MYPELTLIGLYVFATENGFKIIHDYRSDISLANATKMYGYDGS